jgi:hypothetical protein
VVVQFALSFLLSSAGSELLNHHKFNPSISKFKNGLKIRFVSGRILGFPRMFVASSAEHLFRINQNFKIVFCEQKRNAYSEHKQKLNLPNLTTIDQD